MVKSNQVSKVEPGFEDIVNHRMSFIKTSKFNIHMFTSLTNMRIIIVSKPEIGEDSKTVKSLFKQIYSCFAELVTTDSGYSQNQPIQNLPFDQEIVKIFSS